MGIAPYDDSVAPNQNDILRNPDGTLALATTFVTDAHAVALLVHPYTSSPETPFLPSDLRDGGAIDQNVDDRDEQLVFFFTGIDGLFSGALDRAIAGRATDRATVSEPYTSGLMIGSSGQSAALLEGMVARVCRDLHPGRRHHDEPACPRTASAILATAASCALPSIICADITIRAAA